MAIHSILGFFMKRTSFVLLSSLAGFTLGTTYLSSTDYYVGSTTTAGSPDGNVGTCTDPGNTLCTLQDAYSVAGGGDTIHIVPSTVTYTSAYTTPCNISAGSIVSDNANGSVIDFGAFTSTCTASNSGNPTVFQPGGNISLTDVVFHNSNTGGNVVSVNGATMTINGTSVNGGTVGFSNNTWILNQNLQTLTFGATGDYTLPFSDPMNDVGRQELVIISNYPGTLTIGSDITGSNRDLLSLQATAGPLYATGILTQNTVGSDNGDIYITGLSNAIDTLSITMGNCYLSNNINPSSTNSIFMAGGALLFTNSFTLVNYLELLVTGENTINDQGFNVVLTGRIVNLGGSTPIYAKYGSGVQTLTSTISSWTGGINLHAGALSVSNVSALGNNTEISFVGGSLFAGGNLTLPSSYTATGSVAGGGFASAASTTFQIQSNVTGSGILNIGLYSAYLTASGTVSFNNPTPANNTFSGEIVVGALDGANNPYPATFSLSDSSQIGSVSGLTLQGNGVFNTTTTLSTLSLPITVSTGGGTLSPSSGTTLTVPAAIAISSGLTLTIAGGGTVDLTGNNDTFSGSLAVTESSLLSVGTLLDLEGLILDSGQINLNGNVLAGSFSLTGSNTINTGSHVLSFSGNPAVSIGSSLTKTGSGRLSVLPTTSGSGNAFGINVTAGSVSSNTDFLENAAVTLASGTTLDIDQTTAGTFSGSITGDGSVSITGTGLLTFAPSSSSYSGGTTLTGLVAVSGDVFGSAGSTLMVDGGTIEASSAFSVTNPITLTGDLTVDVTAAQDLFQLTGAISGAGNFTKEGVGVLYLTADSNYTGKTYVNAGSLVVNGNISSSPDPIVATGATLSGTGTVGPTDVFGTIKGGNLVGTLTVDGSLIMEPGSELITLATPLQATLVAVTGAVTIDPDAAYLVLVVPGFYSNNYSQVVLSGSSISGTFNSFHSDAAFAGLVYNPTEVILTLSSPVTFAAKGNALQVARGLQGAITYNRSLIESLISGGTVVDLTTLDSILEIPEVLGSLIPFTQKPGLNYALNQLQPSQLKGMTITQENNAVRVRESITQRILNELDRKNCFSSYTKDPQGKDCCHKDEKRKTVWAAGLGDTLVQNNKTNDFEPLTGYRANTGGALIGFDTLFCDHFYAGAIGAYTGSHLHFEEGKGKGNITSAYAGVYLSAIGSGSIGKFFYTNASVIGSWSKYDVDRHIQYEAINLTPKSDHGGNQILSHFDTGLNFNYFGFTVRPFDSFDYLSQIERGYAEHNAGEWELTVTRKNAMMIRNEIGLQFSKCLCFCSSKWLFTPKVSWIREVRIKGATFNVSFTQGGSPFVIHGYFPDRSLVAPGLAITGYMLNGSLLFDLYYNGEFKGDYSSNSYGGQVGYSF